MFLFMTRDVSMQQCLASMFNHILHFLLKLTFKRKMIDPRTYTQTYTPMVQGGGGVLQPFPWVFAVLQYLGNILLLIDSLSCDLQDKIIIMGYDAAGGL